MHRLRLNRGISSFVAILLLTGLSIVAGVVLYSFSGNLIAPLSNDNNPAVKYMVLESAVLTNRELKAYIRNICKETIVIDRVYVNNYPVSGPGSMVEVNEEGELDDKILKDDVGALTVQIAQGFERGKTFSFKIITVDNSFIEFQKQAPTVAPVVKFTNSTGHGVQGIDVKYYSSGWQILGTTDEHGEVLILLEPKNYRFRLTYAGSTKQITQNIVIFPVVEFQTCNVTTKITEADGTPLSGANARYYASGWKTIGTTDENGKVSIELLPMSYNFRMTYGGATLQKTQNVDDDPLVLFQTDKVFVRLRESDGDPIEGGLARYYASGWKTIGTTDENGEVSVSLMPKSYNFRMTYGGATLQKTQDISIDPVVEFNTTLVTVRVLESDNDPIEGALVKYYASGWNTIGTTNSDGEVTSELMPKSYNFRVTYGGATLQKTQDIESNPTVDFYTHLITVKLLESDGDPIEGGTVRYQASGWNIIGDTDINGEVSIELLPLNYRYSMKYGGATTYITTGDQNVTFTTIYVTIKATNSSVPVEDALASYSASGWQTIGYTDQTGEVSVEMLPLNYRFRLKYDSITRYIRQDISTNPLVHFELT